MNHRQANYIVNFLLNYMFSRRPAILLYGVDKAFITSVIFQCNTRTEGNGDGFVHSIT
jgi:hypothetical protein